MTGRWTLDASDVKALCRLADLIVPGDGRWPPASLAIANIENVLADLEHADAAAAIALARRLAPLPPDRCEAALEADRTAEPAQFDRLIRAIYRAYYSTALAMARVKDVADAAPREPSPFFDKNLVAQVIAAQAGKRRL